MDEAELQQEDPPPPASEPLTSDGSPFTCTIATDMPLQNFVDPLLTWWNSWDGADDTMDNRSECLNADLNELGKQAGTPPYKFIPKYLTECCGIKLWHQTKATALCFFLAANYHNPQYIFPPIKLPQFNMEAPFPIFRITSPPQSQIKDFNHQAPSAGHTQPDQGQMTTKPHNHDPALQFEDPEQQKRFNSFVKGMDDLMGPQTGPQAHIPQPTTPPQQHTSLNNGIVWDQTRNVFTKNGMTIHNSKFHYQMIQDADLNWTPDIELTIKQPAHSSLTNHHYRLYQQYQQFLQHLHLDMQYPTGTMFSIMYNPKQTQPQGIAGVPGVILQLEMLLKEYLAADRFATPHPTHGHEANVDLVQSLRHELPTVWHLPLSKLFQHLDNQIKLRGQTNRLLPQHPSQPLDKHTQQALQTLPPNQLNMHPHYRPKPAPSPHRSLPPPMSNYKGKNYDPNFQPKQYTTRTPQPSQGGGPNQGMKPQ